MIFHERIRLLYVACTRASDHLVVSLHRNRGPRRRSRRGERMPSCCCPAWGTWSTTCLTVPGRRRPGRYRGGAGAPSPPPPFLEWEAERGAALEGLTAHDGGRDRVDRRGDAGPRGGARPGAEKRPRDLDLPPWLKGRYGTAVGRAVHGVLQTIDLASGAGLDRPWPPSARRRR